MGTAVSYKTRVLQVSTPDTTVVIGIEVQEKEWNHTLSFHLLHKSNESEKATTPHPAIIQNVNRQQ